MIETQSPLTSRIYNQILKTPSYLANAITFPYIFARGICEIARTEESEINKILKKDYSFER